MCKQLTKISLFLFFGFLISCGDGKNLNDSQNKTNEEPTLNQEGESKEEKKCPCESSESKEEAELKFQKWLGNIKKSSEFVVDVENIQQAAFQYVAEKEAKLNSIKITSKASQIALVILNHEGRRDGIPLACYSADISEIKNNCIPDFYDFVEVLNTYN